MVFKIKTLLSATKTFLLLRNCKYCLNYHRKEPARALFPNHEKKILVKSAEVVKHMIRFWYFSHMRAVKAQAKPSLLAHTK